MSESDKYIDIDYQQSKPLCQKLQDEDVVYFRGNYNDFFHNHLEFNRPCLIPNVTKDWKCLKLWVKENAPNIDYLRGKYGDASVTVADCDQKYYNAQLKRIMNFADFCSYWENLMLNNHPPSEPRLYLKDWHFTRDFVEEQVYIVPSEFCSDWLNEFYTALKNENDDYKFVYMGPKGSWTPFHVDVFTSYSWSVNLCGEKKWLLLPPGEEIKLKDKFGNLPYDISFLEDNTNNNADENDGNNNSSNVNVTFLTINQRPGDAIFVPSGWHHQVYNMQDTISINHNWINACNIDKMWLAMKSNLDDVKREIRQFQNSMDDWQTHCQLLLKSCFGMNFEDFRNFCEYILNQRLMAWNKGTNLKVYGDWQIGRKHINYDISTLQKILKIFNEDPDVRLLSKANN